MIINCTVLLVILQELSNNKATINEAAMLQSHNGYTDIIKYYENGLYSADDEYTGSSLVSAGSQIEGFIEEEE